SHFQAAPGRPSFGQVLDREQALEDPVVQARLAELVAVQDRLDALPPLLEKVQQRRVRGFVVEVLELMEDAGRPVDTETALARTHPEPDPAADVVETGRAAAAGDRLGQMASRDQLALADDLLRVRHRLLGANPRAEPVEVLLLGAWQRL